MSMSPTNRQFSSLLKQIVMILLITTILGSLLTYIYVQQQYTVSMQRDYQNYWNVLHEFQQNMLPRSNQNFPLNFLHNEDLHQQFAAIFLNTPLLIRLCILDTQGNFIFGKETEIMTAYFRTISSSPHQKASSKKPITLPFPYEQVRVVQVPIIKNQQRIGMLRGEFAPTKADTIFLQVASVTLRVTIASALLMVISGIFLIFTQITKHLSLKRQQLTEYALSLEKANEDLRKTRKELHVSEKLASLGYLAAGIAHEIGNPLGSVLGYIELLQKNKVDSENTQDILKRIETEIERIRRIIQELVMFSRPRSMNIETVDVNKIIRNITSQLPVPPDKTIDIQLQLTEFALFADIDARRLQNVFFNIIGNAMDAISSAGRLQIATSRRIRESATIIGGSEVIAIQFSDTGCGIPEENLSKIFDPFFTTKDPGSGMGLGLSLCHRIIESLNGEIEVQSQVGKGTEVTIFLPPARKKELG